MIMERGLALAVPLFTFNTKGRKTMKKGGISVQTENIFPVIKKWLYSDKDIFIRELVSNACDAITKHKRLASLAEAEESTEEYKVYLSIDKQLRTLKVSDNGIGMTEDELDKYINQIALSGALDFIARYEGEDSKGGGIIGHFGLGFYSSFMVASNVEIETKSYTNSPAVYWDCNENGEYNMEDGDKEARGTDITLHVSDEEVEYLDYEKAKSVLEKYCAFMPYPIYIREGEREELINEVQPVWQKQPSEVEGADYNALYKKLFNDYRDPLFYIHINADYPLNFKGVLYFPAAKNAYESNEGCIKLFYNSVFVADNIKEIVPDYLYSLCGVLDCPELPLNVSRSYLQDDSYVRKLSAHIVKKIADKLVKLKNDDAEKYYPLWDAIKPYIEYGCLKDQKFYDRAKDAVLVKKTNGSYTALTQLMQSETEETKVYYTTDPQQQAYYVNLFTEKEIDVYVLDLALDTQFASFLETKNEKLKFLRVDASLDDISDKAEESDGLLTLFANATGKEKEKISFVSLTAEDAPVLIRCNEEERRFADMMRMYAAFGGDAGKNAEEALVINMASPAIQKLEGADGDKAAVIAKHFYLCALVASRALTEAELKEFVESNKAISGYIL